MGYAELLVSDSAQANREQLVGDLQRILDASRTLHHLIQSLLDQSTVRHAAGADLTEYRRTLRHDLRTPINAIKGYGEMLREDAVRLDAKARAAGVESRLRLWDGVPHVWHIFPGLRESREAFAEIAAFVGRVAS